MPPSNLTRADNFETTGLIPPMVSEFFSTFNLIVCAQLIGYCGIVGNVINIWNFSKQGLQDSVNVTLTALALSDIGALITQQLTNIMFSPFWKRVELPFTSSATFAMLFYYPHCYFIRVSGFITTFAAFERCLCVVLPLKVRRIITRNVAFVANVSFFAVLQLYFFPEYYSSYMGTRFFPEKNRTIIVLFYKNNADYVFKVTYFVADMAVPYLTFILLVIFTTVIVIKLTSKAKWRKTVTGKQLESLSKKAQVVSGKEKRLVIMLTTVSVIFIACLTPSCALMTAIGVVRELKVDGPWFDLTMLIYAFTSLLETVNCSVTIVVYYNMSTKYRETIQTGLVWLRKRK